MTQPITSVSSSREQAERAEKAILSLDSHTALSNNMFNFGRPCVDWVKQVLVCKLWLIINPASSCCNFSQPGRIFIWAVLQIPTFLASIWTLKYQEICLKKKGLTPEFISQLRGSFFISGQTICPLFFAAAFFNWVLFRCIQLLEHSNCPASLTILAEDYEICRLVRAP